MGFTQILIPQRMSLKINLLFTHFPPQPIGISLPVHIYSCIMIRLIWRVQVVVLLKSELLMKTCCSVSKLTAKIPGQKVMKIGRGNIGMKSLENYSEAAWQLGRPMALLLTLGLQFSKKAKGG